MLIRSDDVIATVVTPDRKRTHFLFGLVVDDAELGVDRFRALVEVGRLFAGKSIQGERADEGALQV